MYALWPQLVILHARHEALAQPLIDHEDDLGRDLRAQEGRLVEPHVLPFGKVLWHFGQFDARWCLAVTGVTSRM